MALADGSAEALAVEHPQPVAAQPDDALGLEGEQGVAHRRTPDVEYIARKSWVSCTRPTSPGAARSSTTRSQREGAANTGLPALAGVAARLGAARRAWQAPRSLGWAAADYE